MQGKRSNNGFSLVEVLIAVLLVGLAIAALMAANGAMTNANGAGTNLSNAEFLIGEIAELTAVLPVVDPQSEDATFGPEADETTLASYDDLDDFDGATFSPPICAERSVLNSSAGFSQQITVENVSPADFEVVVGDHTSDFVRVTVRIFLNSRQISSASWLRARY